MDCGSDFGVCHYRCRVDGVGGGVGLIIVVLVRFFGYCENVSGCNMTIT